MSVPPVPAQGAPPGLPAAPAQSRAALDLPDWMLLAALTIATCLYAFSILRAHAVPFEDAAMLMRYSQHLAAGHGVVWNVGEGPVDGATDFLFMAAVAGLARLGLPLERAVTLLDAAAHLGTVLLVYAAVRRAAGAPRWMALVSALAVLFGPGLVYAALYFGTPVFAFSAALTWWLALRLTPRAGAAASCAFALSGLVTALIRPEGVILAALMLAAVVCRDGLASSRGTVRAFLGVFLTLGGAYFAWHWAYFGHPLPNPYYKKGGGHLYLGSLRESWVNVWLMAWPFLLVLAAGLRAPAARRGAAVALVPVVGFASAWVLLSNEMNHVMRFQYPLLPLILMSWPSVAVDVMRGSPFTPLPLPATGHRADGGLLAALALAAPLLAFVSVRCGGYRGDLRVRSGHSVSLDVARRLRPFAPRGYTLATTEAGVVPLYSDWRAVDAWGLNDPWIAHHGGVTAAYLERYRPEVIEIHGPYKQALPPRFSWAGDTWGSGRGWYEMVSTLNFYAVRRGYRLASVIHPAGDPYAWYYYVRPDFPDSREVSAGVSSP